MHEINALGAVELRELLATKQVSCREVLDTTIEWIEKVNPRVNALVTKAYDTATATAERLDKVGDLSAPLAGLPTAHKDLARTKGIRTTFGSPLFTNHIPDTDDLIIDRIKRAGAVSLGKTNTPEFGAGSNTFNTIFGSTHNPYDLTRTCGGSSGGAAVCLATRMMTIADGGDFGGSLRNPAAFCNVVGFRPSPGRIPNAKVGGNWSDLATLGPMARCIDDVALMFSVIAGPTPYGYAALETPGETFRRVDPIDLKGRKIAFTTNFGNLEIETPIVDCLLELVHVLEDAGAIVENACPNLADADRVFQILRGLEFRKRHGGLSQPERATLKETILWNLEFGESLTIDDLLWAQGKRAEILRNMGAFFADFDLLVGPVTQVLPYTLDIEWPQEINGKRLETYIDWMQACSLISTTCTPTLSLPAGFADGLPVGVQLVAPYRADLFLLRAAKSIEEATRFHEIIPVICEQDQERG